MAPDGQNAGVAPTFGSVAADGADRGQSVSAMAAPAEELALALAQHAHAARGAYAANTERALRADVAVFSGWCVAAGRVALPASAATVAAFVDAMGEARAPATVRRYVSSVATFHRAARMSNPCADEAVHLALKRLHRARGRAQAQAAPLTRDLVDRMLAAAGNGPRALRNRALLAVAYDSLCRRSELVALQRTDLEAAEHGAGTLSIRRSKTDQEGVGQVRYLAPDTMRHVAAWLAASGHADGGLFRAVAKGGTIGGKLDPGDVARVFKAMAAAAGIEPALVAAISGHSSRVGAAQDQVRHGVELPAVMQAGGWTSPTMVARYSAKLEARRGGAAKLALLQNRT
jgi:integrase